MRSTINGCSGNCREYGQGPTTTTTIEEDHIYLWHTQTDQEASQVSEEPMEPSQQGIGGTTTTISLENRAELEQQRTCLFPMFANTKATLQS